MPRNQPLAFAAIAAGGLLITSGLSGRQLSDVAQGKVHKLTDSQGNRIQGSLAATINSAPSSGPGGLVNPFAHAQANVGRVDQGVDVSLQPGDPILALGTSRLVGIIPSWYAGQPFAWFQLLNEHGQPTPTTAAPHAGKYWYAAEQITGLPRIGSVIPVGQPIGTYAQSGTALEVGWATASGQTAARAAGDVNPSSHYSAEGQDFANLLHSLGL